MAKSITLIGNYTGNQTLSLSSIGCAGASADDFIIELISLNGAAAYFNPSGGSHPSYVSKTAQTISKTISDNNLVIAGATYTVTGSGSGASASAEGNITYNLYYYK